MAALFASCGLAACLDIQAEGECNLDSDCARGETCDVSAHTCVAAAGLDGGLRRDAAMVEDASVDAAPPPDALRQDAEPPPDARIAPLDGAPPPSDAHPTDAAPTDATRVDPPACDAGALVDAACDGIDDDCDGRIDEAPPCNGCPVGTLLPEGFVCVPAGEFSMGARPGEVLAQGGAPVDDTYPATPQHRVRLTQPFLVSDHELTRSELLSSGVFGAEGLDEFQDCGPDCPVVGLSWWGAAALANQLSSIHGLSACYRLPDCEDLMGSPNPQCVTVEFVTGCLGFRMPTEAQWEYMARAGSDAVIYSARGGANLDVLASNDAPMLDTVAWYGGNSVVRYSGGVECAEWPGRPAPPAPRGTTCGVHPVRSKVPNRWGIYDALGNVDEWTEDYIADYGDGIDRRLTVDPGMQAVGRLGENRVRRGGHWSGAIDGSEPGARGVRASARNAAAPGRSLPTTGVRFVRAAIRPAQ